MKYKPENIHPTEAYICAMKNLAAICLLLLSLPSYGRDGGKSGMDCKRFKTGKFYIDDSLSGRTLIERYDSVQLETIVDHHVKIELRIKWVNDCTYILTLKKIIKDPEDYTRDWDKSLILTSTITSITGNSYLQTTTGNLNSNVIVFKVIKMK
jgi:hypothetical protein